MRNDNEGIYGREERRIRKVVIDLAGARVGRRNNWFLWEQPVRDMINLALLNFVFDWYIAAAGRWRWDVWHDGCDMKEGINNLIWSDDCFLRENIRIRLFFHR